MPLSATLSRAPEAGAQPHGQAAKARTGIVPTALPSGGSTRDTHTSEKPCPVRMRPLIRGAVVSQSGSGRLGALAAWRQMREGQDAAWCHARTDQREQGVQIDEPHGAKDREHDIECLVRLVQERRRLRRTELKAWQVPPPLPWTVSRTGRCPPLDLSRQASRGARGCYHSPSRVPAPGARPRERERSRSARDRRTGPVQPGRLTLGVHGPARLAPDRVPVPGLSQ